MNVFTQFAANQDTSNNFLENLYKVCVCPRSSAVCEVFLLSSYQQLSSSYIQLLFWAFIGTLQCKTYDPDHGNLTAWNSTTPITVFLQTACLGFLQKSVDTSQL